MHGGDIVQLVDGMSELADLDGRIAATGDLDEVRRRAEKTKESGGIG